MNITINELSARLNCAAATAEIVKDFANNSSLDNKEAFQQVMLSLEQITEQLHICAAMGAILNDTADVSSFECIPIDTH